MISSLVSIGLVLGYLASSGLTAKVCGTNLITYKSAKEVFEIQKSGLNLGIIGFGSCDKVCVLRDPICGSDARTYYNYCHLAIAARGGEDISIIHAGHCGFGGEYVVPPGNQPTILENIKEMTESEEDSTEKLYSVINKLQKALVQQTGQKFVRHSESVTEVNQGPFKFDNKAHTMSKGIYHWPFYSIILEEKKRYHDVAYDENNMDARHEVLEKGNKSIGMQEEADNVKLNVTFQIPEFIDRILNGIGR